MILEIDDKRLEVVIIRKKTNKNTYMRVKEDLKIYVTTNSLVSDRKIKQILDENKNSILKMYDFQVKKNNYEEKFFLLGKEYDVIRTNQKDVVVGEFKAFIPVGFDIDKWLKKYAEVLFLERLNYYHSNFKYSIPPVKLRIRKMKSRWGVCNTKDKVITLNLELMKKDVSCLDYVIVHELSHLIEANHSNRFWKVVEANFPNYKEKRRELKNYE